MIIKDENLKKKCGPFIRFLKERKLYYKFFKEFHKTSKDIVGYFNSTKASNFIFSAFPWYRTDEGEYFWFKIYREWEQVCLYGK